MFARIHTARRLPSAMPPRALHPGAGWLWALGLATAASRTTNPLLLALILAVAGLVVAARRGDAPWALAFRMYLLLGAVIIGVRVVFRIVVGSGGGGENVLFTLPEVSLPAAGLRLFGPVTAEQLLGGFYDGLRLATIVVCVGAANALANPKRLLKALPGALFGMGTAVVVALSMLPQLVDSVLRVRRARRLRGGRERGVRALRGIAIPVLVDAMDRSLRLAAAMDSRGYGRTAGVPARHRALTGALVIAGVAGICVGCYGVLDGTAPAALGAPMLAGGVLLAGVGRGLGGRRVRRTVYRPDRWRAAELLVAGCGIAGAHRRPGRSHPGTPGGAAVIVLEQVTVTYPDQTRPVLAGVDIRIPRGRAVPCRRAHRHRQSTLLGVVNGLVPHFTGGHLRGRVTVNVADTRTHPPRELAHLVGVVGQDPLAGFVTDTVEEELAYAMEQLAVPPPVMRKRVEETLDLLGIAELRGRPLRALSGGQQQRVAIGAALTPQPRVLVLDEPTSALDLVAAEEVLAAITRLVHDLAVTVLVAEHRMERVVQYADRLVLLPGGGRVVAGDPATVLATSPVAPGRWRARAAGRLVAAAAVRARRPPPRRGAAGTAGRAAPAPHVPTGTGQATSAVGVHAGGPVRRAGGRRRGGPGPLRREVVAVMGRNGSGKSSLLWALQGSGTRHGGRVQVGGADPAGWAAHQARRRVGLVPQTPADLLYLPTVADECAQADRESGAAAAPKAPLRRPPGSETLRRRGTGLPSRQRRLVVYSTKDQLACVATTT